jgi:hypothetical protein
MNPITGPVPSNWLEVLRVLPQDRYVAALVVLATFAFYRLAPPNFKHRLLVFGILCLVALLLILGPDYIRAKNVPDIYAGNRYAISAHFQGTRRTVTSSPTSFSISSGQINFGCEQIVPVSVSFPLPQNANVIAQDLKWTNQSNSTLLNISEPTRQGDQLSGAATVRGLNFETFPFGIKNCPGGGHGELVLSGAYKTDQIVDEPVDHPLPPGILSGAQRPVIFSLPQDPTLKINKIIIHFSGIGPSTPRSDELVLTPPGVTAATSADGKFVATIDNMSNLQVDLAK